MSGNLFSNIGAPKIAKNPSGGGISAGAKRSLFQANAKMASIFDTIDKDKNGVIDQKEYNQYFDKNGDGTVSEKETKAGLKELNNFLKGNAKTNGEKFEKDDKISQQDLEKFLGICGTNSENIESVQTIEQDGKPFVQIKYNNGDIDTVSTSSQAHTHVGTNEALGLNGTTTYNEEGVCTTFEGLNKDNENVTINFAADGVHYDKMITESNVEIPGTDGAESTTLRQSETTTFVPGSDNVPEQTVLTYPDKPADKTTINYESGQPANIEIQSGTTNSTFTIDENGNKIPQQIIQNQGLSTQQTTTYTYGENITEIRTVDAENKPVQIQTFDNEKGTITTRTYGASTGDIEVYTETVVSNNYATKSEYIDGEMMSQTLTTKDGNQYHADYDGNGNTKITIQENETLEKIAKKFGCSVDDLKKLNTDLNKLNTGEQLIVPGKLEPDDAKLIIRKTPEQIKADQTERARKANQRLQAEKADVQRTLKSYYVLDTPNYGKPKTVIDLSTGKPKTYTIVGKNKSGGYFLRDKEGNFYAQPREGDSNNPAVAVPIRADGAKAFSDIKGGIYINHPQLGRLVEVRTNDAGSKIYQDIYGNQYIQDRYDEKLLPKGNDQLQQDLSKFLDKEAYEIRQSMALLKANQTWSEKLGEYIASSVTNKGTTAGLDRDMRLYEQKLAMLRDCVNDGDTEGFKILFKEIFNMPYSEKNVKALLNAAQSGDVGTMNQLRSQTMRGDFGNMQSNFEAVESQNTIGGYVVEGTTTLLTLGVGAELQTAVRGGQVIATGSEKVIDLAQEFGNLPENQRNLILSGDNKAFVTFTWNFVMNEVTGMAFNNGLSNGLSKFVSDNKTTKEVRDILIDGGSEQGLTGHIIGETVNQGKKETTSYVNNIIPEEVKDITTGGAIGLIMQKEL